MKLTALHVLPYRTAAGRAPRNAQRSWPMREGLLIQLRDERGRIGQGEAAPLPGFSREDVNACRSAAQAFEVERLPELSPSNLLAALAEVGSRATELPALRCALETAVLDLIAQERGEPAWATLLGALPERTAPEAVALAALLQAETAADRLNEAQHAVTRGIRTLKVKVGRPGEFEQELAELATLRARFAAVELRIDANRAWSAAQAQRYLAELAHLRPEYVEEPSADWAALAHSPTPLALDESLTSPDVTANVLARRHDLNLRACILKPTLLGGVVRCFEIAQSAARAGLACVLSHAFEGPVGFSLACALALALNDSTRAAGLAPHAFLNAWNAKLPGLDDTAIRTWNEAGLGLPALQPPSAA